MLAVVQQEQRSAAAERAHDGVAELRPGRHAHPEGARNLVEDEGRIGHRGQIDPPDPTRELGPHPPGHLERQTSLSDPARAGQGQEPTRLEELRHLLELAPPSHERCEASRQIAWRLGRLERETGSLQQEVVEIADLGGGIDPKLFAQPHLKRAGGLECLGLAATAVQGENELSMKRLVVRVLLDQLRELGDELVMSAELQADVEPGLERLQLLALQIPSVLAHLRRRFREVGEGNAPPQPHRVGEDLVGRLGVAVTKLAALGDGGKEAFSVELVRQQPEHVPASVALDARTAWWVAEERAQTRDVHVHEVVRTGRRLVIPELVDEPIVRDGHVGRGQEHPQECALGGSSQLERAVRGCRAEGPENVEFHCCGLPLGHRTAVERS